MNNEVVLWFIIIYKLSLCLIQGNVAAPSARQDFPSQLGNLSILKGAPSVKSAWWLPTLPRRVLLTYFCCFIVTSSLIAQEVPRLADSLLGFLKIWKRMNIIGLEGEAVCGIKIQRGFKNIKNPKQGQCCRDFCSSEQYMLFFVPCITFIGVSRR